MTLPKIAFIGNEGNEGIKASNDGIKTFKTFDGISITTAESWRWTCGRPTAGDVAPAAPGSPPR